MPNQKINYTYLSENIEKHAKPNNTCEVYDEQSYVKNTHPMIDEIKLNYLTNELKIYFNNLTSLGFMERTRDSFKINDHTKQGFPRLMINLKDEQIYKLSKQKHNEQYKNWKELTEKVEHVKNLFHNINNIKVCEIKDHQPHKTAFVKILGDHNDHTQRVMMYGKNKQTLFAAFKRQIKSAPLPDKSTIEKFLRFSYKVIEDELGEELDNFNYDVSQWFNHLSRQKQKQITPIYNYYFHRDKLQDYTEKQIEEMLNLHYTAIVKSEIQELDGKPRMVCSIPQHIKFVMGPITWMLEEIFAKKLKGYCGGMNLIEMRQKINNYLQQGFEKIVEGDGSAFDNTQDITLKSVDRYIYNRIKDKIYHVDKEIFELIANSYYKTMDINYKDYYFNKVKTMAIYHVLGTVFSGDCDTTLMNTTRMVLYNRFVNEQAGLRYDHDYVVLSKGDDFSVLYKTHITDQQIDDIYYKYFLPASSGPDEISDKRQFGLGQILKFLDKGDASTFKFCSLKSLYLDEGHTKITLIRDPKKLYNKALYSTKYKSYNPKQQYSYHVQQAISYKVNYGGIEMFELMAKAHFEQANAIKKLHNLKLNRKQITINTKLEEELQLKNKINMTTIEFTDNEFMNKIMYNLMDIKQREKYINYYTKYWEQTQKTELQRSENNTILELEYINKQLMMEFDVEELKSLLTLK